MHYSSYGQVLMQQLTDDSAHSKASSMLDAECSRKEHSEVSSMLGLSLFLVFSMHSCTYPKIVKTLSFREDLFELYTINGLLRSARCVTCNGVVHLILG
eukprot:5718752-Amphidinium_carterae.1